MTIAELIQALQQQPDQTALVIIPGYEGGYSCVGELVRKHIALNVNTSWYYGPHDDAGEIPRDFFNDNTEELATAHALLLLAETR